MRPKLCNISIVSAVLAILFAACGGGDEAPLDDDATLTELVVSEGVLVPEFSTDVTEYTLDLTFFTSELEVTATSASVAATLAIADREPVPGRTAAARIGMEVGAIAIPIEVTAEAGNTLTYNISVNRPPLANLQNQFLKFEAIDRLDSFGAQVALSGDTLAVSVPFEDSITALDPENDTAPDAGAVVVFRRDGEQWAQEAYLKASNLELSDAFGSHIALDGNVLVVGVPREDSFLSPFDNDLLASGAVYVFRRSGSQWSEEAFIKAPNLDASDGFGRSVAISGDTLVVGAINEASNGSDPNDNSLAESGAAYVYRDMGGGNWMNEAILKASNPGTFDHFGVSVSLDGDVLAVGASGESSADPGNPLDNNAPSSGAVYVFRRSGDQWAEEGYLKALDPGMNDSFGDVVAIDGDSLAVGAFGDDSGDPENPADNSKLDGGAVFVFRRTGGRWVDDGYLKAPMVDAGDRFGASVALSGTILVIGTPSDDSLDTEGPNNNFSVNSGALYVFGRRGDAWIQDAFLKAPNLDPFEEFGHSVALEGGVLAVGMPLEASGDPANQDDETAMGSGAVYVFE